MLRIFMGQASDHTKLRDWSAAGRTGRRTSRCSRTGWRRTVGQLAVLTVHRTGWRGTAGQLAVLTVQTGQAGSPYRAPDKGSLSITGPGDLVRRPNGGVTCCRCWCVGRRPGWRSARGPGPCSWSCRGRWRPSWPRAEGAGLTEKWQS